MFFKQWIVFILCMAMFVAMWCMFVISINKVHEKKVVTTLQPMDLTVTFCESCKKCTIPEANDLLEFEDCDDEDIKGSILL